MSWRAAARFLRSPVRPLLDALSTALYPASCSVCTQSLLRFSSLPICDDCWSSVTRQDAALCLCCGEALDIPQSSLAWLAPEDQHCDACQKERPAFAKAVAYGNYEDTLRRLIHLMKYEGLTPIAQRLGSLLAEPVAELPIADGADVLVVPVPLYRGKQRQRGFNQAERIAHALTLQLRKTERSRRKGEQARGRRRWTIARAALRRQRSTESQSRLSPAGRARNLRHAFRVRDAAMVRGREVLLVDDIYTTGATAAACTRVLLRAGATRVWVATVARAQREGVALWDGGATAGDGVATAGDGAATAASVAVER